MKLLLNDSSVLLNLIAGDCLSSIAADLGWQFAICPAVRDEAKKLRDPLTGDLVRLDIIPFIESGLLIVLELANEREEALYVDQAAVVDDGEAMSIAIAASRGLELAIDDKQAANHARRAFPHMKLWTTPELLKQWSQVAILSSNRLSEVISQIESRARYFPANSHPLRPWWQAIKGSD
jgi:hypothetical protein